MLSKTWLIEESSLSAVIQAADRMTSESFADFLPDSYKSTVTRDGVAVIPLKGVIVKEATYLSKIISLILGGTVLSSFEQNLADVLENPLVRSIVLDIHSPGGEALGIEAAAQSIRAAAAIKPVTAVVNGMAASAAYWLGSAAGSMTLVGQSSQVGSIGVVLALEDSRERDAKNGVTRHQIVSSQSPSKRVDPATDEGRSELQSYVDALAAVFVSAVAQYRGVSVEHVMEKFGRGGMKLADEAIAAGMADAKVESFEQAFALAAKAHKFGGAAANSTKEVHMDNPTQAAADKTAVNVDQVRADAVKAERDRIGAILRSEDAKGRLELATELALSGVAADDAARILKASPKAAANPLAAAMAGVQNPTVGADGGKAGEDVNALVADTLALFGVGKEGK